MTCLYVKCMVIGYIRIQFDEKNLILRCYVTEELNLILLIPLTVRRGCTRSSPDYRLFSGGLWDEPGGHRRC